MNHGTVETKEAVVWDGMNGCGNPMRKGRKFGYADFS